MFSKLVLVITTHFGFIGSILKAICLNEEDGNEIVPCITSIGPKVCRSESSRTDLGVLMSPERSFRSRFSASVPSAEIVNLGVDSTYRGSAVAD